MLQRLIQNIPDILVVIDPNGSIRFSNPQLETVLGVRIEDVVGRQIFDFIHPDDRRRAELEFSHTIQKKGEGVPSTLRVRDARGDWIAFEIIANNQIDDPDIRGVIFTARDLRYRVEVEEAIRLANADVDRRVEERTTELANANSALRIENRSRRESERKLRETVSLLSATLNSTADGILVVNKDRKVTGCNRQFIDMWDLQCQSAVGLSDYELLSSVIDQLQNPDEFIRKVEALYVASEASSSDVLRFKDGRIYERYSQPQRMDDQIVGRVWSFRDVTEPTRLEEERRQLQKLEALGRLASGVAHDFNNLLMLISGYLERLADLGLSSVQGEICEQAMGVTKRAATVTRQLLAFSRKHRDDATVTDLNTVVSNIHGMLGALLSSSIRFDVSLSDHPVPILADINQLEVILLNLAINSQDAMPDGGVLSVTTGTQEQDSQKLAVLTVSDTGRGMPPEVKKRIFEPFFTTKAVGKGTGLGLSIANEIVRRFGGHIEVDSELHKGTRIRVYLPETTRAPEVKKDVATPPPMLRGHETILLAEDEVGIRAMTRAYLESLGYKVLEAANGAEAINISHEYEGPIDLVLTDVLMPIVRGDAVVRSIRRERPSVKALYMSGFSEDLGGDGAANLLLKPFDFPELGRRVRSTLDFVLEHQKLA
jgi:PAS domain S-box-containing protein